MAIAKQEKITPVQLGKKWGMRPQMIFNWIKQGCPSYEIAGHKYVIEDEVRKWDEDKKKGKEAKKAIREAKSSLSPRHRELLAKLSSFKPQKVEHECFNCSPRDDETGEPIGKLVKTMFMCDITYSGDPMENYITAFCSDCGLNHRYLDEVPNEVCEQILDGELRLWVPSTNRFTEVGK